ncbi:hypothetical protein, variant 2 [Blastomyces gilchristii SLH14081]|uniref:Tat pathway signal sequence n=1 Tax=Blastomyces gilchristii (strain SLH14081) TaxID=559298 RepID=A0A179UW63_BLAGS|nr:hypothetical protein, variant 2 [Blastomyces gilchristii SLH14081]XP_031579438.1 uncharacterized protein BDBG_06459 [Blastomyces gilchristii SLH14081]XP_031579439.1 hypothetical protein, variant 1 [Blastomyces gilchristii SLH14081]OAT10641.1 hypothetical protein BDBG_06459 [Blastomyces gilchristii SLH14081]OAT10642.1 hypothetical protein, variant 1 [Blastomyces gilchristii SLH14081]OAT10643.1 hypothetical protein, variant 2 [Blastomyces gilchristii SLH14081]
MFRKWIGQSRFNCLNRELDDYDGEAEESLLTKRLPYPNHLTSSRTKCIFSAAAGFIIGVSSVLVYLLCISSSPPMFGKNAALKQTSYWSKVLDEIEIPTYTVRMNGTLFPPPDPDFSRQEPSAENDATWEVFEKIRTHVVTRDDIIKLGKDPDTVARFDDEYWGFEQDAYMAQLDIFHQIHCLNRLRKAAFATYPGYTPVETEDAYSKIWWVHIGHCVDMLLQNIKCYGNTDMITVAWVGDHGKLWPDFSINHKCRDFDAIMKWNLEHAVDVGKFSRMPLPKDAYLWPKPWADPEAELGHPLGKNEWKEGRQCH